MGGPGVVLRHTGPSYHGRSAGEHALYEAMRRVPMIYQGKRGKPFAAAEGRLLAGLLGALGIVCVGLRREGR